MASAFVSVLGIAYSLWLLAGVYVYLSLIRQISARTSPSPDAPSRTFGLAEAIVATFLISFLLLNVFVAISKPSTALSSSSAPVDQTHALVSGLILVIVIVFILVGFLKLRGLDLDALGGFSKFGIVRAVSTGAALLIFAWPLVSLAGAVTQRLFPNISGEQSIIELFNGSQTMQQRIIIIILAVTVAPIAEELMFRFFIYGVLRRYFGCFVGLIFNALLFGAVHGHLPSFAPLLVLGACFTLAYEWSGSILVSMSMHALFNSLQLTFLAFPQLSQR
jgi:membrane protease YdiL (CAAX protease family)